MNVIRVKCQKEQHQFLELACLNKQCKANRIYCHQCLQAGDHVAHPNDQRNLVQLIDFFHNIDKQSENLISKLCFMVKQIKELMFQLNQELRTKYQFSKERLQQLNANQLNSALHQILQYDEIKIHLIDQLEICSNNMIKQIKIQINELKLDQVNQYQLNKQEQERVNELYQKAYKLYQDNDKYEEANKFLDAALLIDQNHLNSLSLKALCLQMLYNFKDAIIWANKALLINSNHLESLSTKAKCLYMLDNYKDAIIWADKALSIHSKHVNSLETKCESLQKLGQYDQALKIIDLALNQDPNSDYRLYLKGNCLQSFKRYKEAIVYYDKVLQIDPNWKFCKNKKAECEKKINNYKQIK